MASNRIDWTEFLVDDGLSLEEERNTSLAYSEYLIKKKNEETILPSYEVKNTLKIDLNNFSSNDYTDFAIDYSDKEIFELLAAKNTELANPTIPFPKSKSLDEVFNFLLSIYDLCKEETHLIFQNVNNSNQTLIDSLCYFNYIFPTENSEYLITENFYNLNLNSIEEKYVKFITRIGTSATVRNILRLQLSTRSFDSINKSIIRDDLLKDRSIIEQQLKNEALKPLINNMRYWYLSVRNKLKT